MDNAEILLIVFVVGAVIGAVLLHFGHAKVSKALAVAEAKLKWIEDAPRAAAADVEAAVSRVLAPVSADMKGVVAKVDAEIAKSSAPVPTEAPVTPAAPVASTS